VLAAFRAGGDGWQTRMNDALKDWLKSHSAASPWSVRWPEVDEKHHWRLRSNL
jgi:hypothetical protein